MLAIRSSSSRGTAEEKGVAEECRNSKTRPASLRVVGERASHALCMPVISDCGGMRMYTMMKANRAGCASHALQQMLKHAIRVEMWRKGAVQRGVRWREHGSKREDPSVRCTRCALSFSFSLLCSASFGLCVCLCVDRFLRVGFRRVR